MFSSNFVSKIIKAFLKDLEGLKKLFFFIVLISIFKVLILLSIGCK